MPSVRIARRLATASLVALRALTSSAFGDATHLRHRTGVESALAASSTSSLATQLGAYAGPLGPFADGVWHTSDTGCWACDTGGPATAAATLYVLGHGSSPQYLTEAVDTINTAIAGQQQSDGAFADPNAGTDGEPDGISTIFFGVELGTTYELLSPYLRESTRRDWQHSLSRAAQYLVHSGNIDWYANGNLNLAQIELYYLAWRSTGLRAFERDYNSEWSFTLNPGPRWPGYGLRVTRPATDTNGDDGAGYLTETGAGGTGFDPEYTELQLDVASRLYFLSRDPRALYMTNILLNQLLPRVNASWQLNTSSGTRHTESNREVCFLSSALAVLTTVGGRSSLDSMVEPELNEEEACFSQPSQADNPVFRRAIGDDLSVIALAQSGWSPPESNFVSPSVPAMAPTVLAARATIGNLVRRYAPQVA